MGELDKNQADKLVERLARKKFLDASNLERYDETSHSNHNFRTSQHFIKIERYFNFRERIAAELAVSQEINIKASTTELVDHGHINGYSYRIFRFEEGKSLDTSQEQSLEDLETEKQAEKIREIGKSLAYIHESRSFESFGKIDTLDRKIIGTSAENWREGLKDIQYFWHHQAGRDEIEKYREDIENYYSNRAELLNNVNESVLLHQELGLHNILFDKDSVKVIDWESACAGDPLLDVISTEVILFWSSGIDEELKQVFRKGYREVRELNMDEELREIYRVVQLSRLLIVFSDDKEEISRVKQELDNILYN